MSRPGIVGARDESCRASFAEVHVSRLAAATLPGGRRLGRRVVRVIPIGIVLLLLEIVVEFVVEIVEARFLVDRRLRDRQILLVTEIILLVLRVVDALDPARPPPARRSEAFSRDWKRAGGLERRKDFEVSTIAMKNGSEHLPKQSLIVRQKVVAYRQE